MKKAFLKFFHFLFSASNKSIEKIASITTASYTDVEKDLYNILSAMTLSADLNEIHCDTTTKKYYVVVGNRIVVIDGSTNKVFMLIECKKGEPDCEDNMYPFVIRESVITDFIDLLAKRKHLHTEKIYERVLACEKKFLTCFEAKVKGEI